MSVMLEFSISPLDQGASVGESVAQCLDLVDRSGIPYRLNPMGTVLEGDWDAVFGVVRQCFDQVAQDSERISISIKVDYRAGAEGRLAGKTRSVEERLGRKLEQ